MNVLTEKLNNKKPVAIAFLGDSVTQGCFEIRYTRDDKLEPVYKPGKAYPQKLQKILQHCYPETAINILNYGISGNTASMGLARMDEMLVHKPDAVIVCFGLNDCAYGIEGLGEYRTALENIFRKLDGIQTIFMTPNITNSRVCAFETDARIVALMDETAKRQNDGIMNAYMECARTLCEECGIAICDCYRIWESMEKAGIDTGHLLSNGINHPDEKMHWLFAFELFKAIINMKCA